MTRQRYPEIFTIEAVKQITERGRPVADVAQVLGVSSHSLGYQPPISRLQSVNNLVGLHT